MEPRCHRRAFMQRLSALCGAAPLEWLVSHTQSARVRRIGFMIGGLPSLIDAFKDASRGLGYIEGQNLFLDLRIASGSEIRIAADYVDRILKGAKPGDLPIRQPARYFWTVNRTAAKGLGLTLTPAVLAQADRVIS